MVELWAQYAKERYDAKEKRLADSRNWARQLAAGMGAVVGIEVALAMQIPKFGEALPGLPWILGLAFVVGVVGWQLSGLAGAVGLGYMGREVLSPESPAVIRGLLHGQTTAWTREAIANYYAKGADNVHEVAEEVTKDVAGVAKRFRYSLWLFYAVIVLTSGLGAASLVGKAMTENSEQGSSSPSTGVVSSDVPAQSPPSSPPAPAPLITPTTGQTETKGLGGPREVLATPTAGQRVTEGVRRK